MSKMSKQEMKSLARDLTYELNDKKGGSYPTGFMGSYTGVGPPTDVRLENFIYEFLKDRYSEE